jgi:hypothetical protein
MSSSFADKNAQQEHIDVFLNVMALFSALKNAPRPLSIKRAELNQSGEVKCEGLDFCCDVEMKAKRILNPIQYRLVLKYAIEDRYASVPKKLQQALGAVFMNSNLNFDGDYKVLYFRAKNNQLQDRVEMNIQQFPEGTEEVE